MIRVLLVDDQELVRGGFRMILDARDDIEVIGEAGDGADALTLAAQLNPDVVLMDVRMPGMNGIDATRRIVASGSAASVLVLTTYDADEYVFDALRAGASGFLLKDVRPSELVNAVRVAAGGEAILSPSVTRRMLEHFAANALPTLAHDSRVDVLTDREMEVLRLVAQALTNAEIAERLFVSETTVKSHVSSMLRKLQLRDRVQAVVFAYEAGIARPGDA